MSDFDPSSESERLSAESKVGLFVLAGLAVLMVSILMLGDIHFHPQNTYYVLFKNVEGVAEKTPIKISGVDVGSVGKVELMDDHARLTIALRREIKLYKNARARIRSTGIIGSKFLALIPGEPEPGASEEEQRLKSGATIVGEDVISLDELMERVAKSLDQFTGNGKLADNLNVTVANLRSITDSLNAAIGEQRKAVVDIVKNIEGFSAYAKSAAAHLDDILATNKENLRVAIQSMKDMLGRLNDILANIQQGKGAVGALVSNPQTGEDVKQTITNLKDTSESAKEVLARFTRVRAFWEIQGRRDFKAGDDRGDFGLRLEPRPGHYYEIMGQNLSTEGSTRNAPADYERTNTITGLIGRQWGPVSGAVGAIESRAGVEARYRPFQETDVPVFNRLELIGQGFDFGRDSVIKGRHFTNPDYVAGARFKVNPWLSAGVQAEDIAETTDWTGVVHVEFEDRDIAYLLGFVSFAH